MSDALQGKVEPPVRNRKVIAERAAETIAQAVGYGGTITEKDFRDLFGITIPRMCSPEVADQLRIALMSLQATTKEILLKTHKMALVSCGRKRWTIVAPQAQGAHARAVAKDAVVKGFSEALAIASNVKVDALTDAQRRELDDTAGRLAAVRMAALAGMRTKGLPSGK